MTTQVADFNTLSKMSVAQFIATIRRAPEPPKAKEKPPVKPLPSLGDPTPERRSKEPDGFEEREMKAGTVYRAAEVMHRVREPLAIYEAYFSKAELAVAEYFANDAEAASAVGITSRWDGMPSIGSGPRTGGVAEAKRARYNRFCAVLEQLPEEMRAVLAMLVLCVRDEATGKPTTVQAVGRLLAGAKGEELARGIGIGYLKGALAMVHSAYRTVEAGARRR